MKGPGKQGGGWAGKGSRQSRGYGREWDRLRPLVIARDEGFCVPCRKRGRIEAFFAVDHILSKAEGGTDSLDNLQCICRACHAEKSSAEGARAQGRKVKPRIGADGWPE